MALRVGCSHENLLLEQESPCRRSSCTPSPAPAPRHKWVTNFDLNCLPNRQANISLPQGITVKPAASCAFTSILPPLPFPKLQSCCSSRLGRAATSQFREGKGEGRGGRQAPRRPTPSPQQPPAHPTKHGETPQGTGAGSGTTALPAGSAAGVLGGGAVAVNFTWALLPSGHGLLAAGFCLRLWGGGVSKGRADVQGEGAC